MMIRSKEEFVDLYLAIRANSGYLTFTQKYPDDFFPWLKIGKYDDLFSFFHTLDDFNFYSSFEKYYKSGKGSIHLIHSDSTGEDTVRLYPDFCYLEVEKILKQFDGSLCSKMSKLIYDMEKTKILNDKLQYDGVQGVYQMANPNGFYTLNSNDKLFVDGVVSDLGNGDYLVEDALFSISEKFSGDKLSEMRVLSFYENDDYVDYAINQILFLNYRYSSEKAKSFREVEKNKIYQYKSRY